MQPGERVQQLLLGVRHDPAQVVLLRRLAPVRGLHARRAGRSGWRRRWPAPGRRRPRRVAFSASSTQNSKPAVHDRLERRLRGRADPAAADRRPGAARPATGVPGSAVSARCSVSARSRLMSPEAVSFCRPSSTAPSSRRSAGQAIGSTVASVTDGTPSGSPPFSVSSTVAAGTSSRSATQSHSPGRPSKGRCTSSVAACAAARPWQAL